MEGSLRFEIDWASLIVGSNFSVFALFYFVFGGNFPSASPLQRAYIWRGDLTEMFLRYRFGGLIFGGAYFRNFTVYEELCTILKRVILLDLHNSSDHTQSHSIIAKYLFSFVSATPQPAKAFTAKEVQPATTVKLSWEDPRQLDFFVVQYTILYHEDGDKQNKVSVLQKLRQQAKIGV